MRRRFAIFNFLKILGRGAHSNADSSFAKAKELGYTG